MNMDDHEEFLKKLTAKMAEQSKKFMEENPTYIPMTNSPFYYDDNIATFVPINIKETENDT